mgnify:CR=1 FL=1
MTVQSDNIKAMAILDSIKGFKVQDDNGKIYSVADVKCFNGQVYAIGLKDDQDVIKYASLDYYMEMADVG